jgi:hypothetical protein
VPRLIEWLSYSIHPKYTAAVCGINAFIILQFCLWRKSGWRTKVDFRKSRRNAPQKTAVCLLLLSFLLLSVLFWFKHRFGVVRLEELLYYAYMPLTGSNMDIVYSFVLEVIAADFLIVFGIIILSNITITNKNNSVIFHIDREKIHRFETYTAPPVFAAAVLLVFFCMDFPAVVNRKTGVSSTFYEQYYINPKTVNFIYPEKRRNLILIFIESLETGFLPKDKGGCFNENLLPNVCALAENNINFSETSGAGGGVQLYGTGWTIGGISSYLGGVPLLIPPGYDRAGGFMPGITTLGDILNGGGGGILNITALVRKQNSERVINILQHTAKLSFGIIYISARQDCCPKITAFTGVLKTANYMHLPKMRCLKSRIKTRPLFLPC